MGSWMGPGHQKHQAAIRSLTLSAPLSLSRRGRGAANRVRDRSCCPQKHRVWRASSLLNTKTCWEDGTPSPRASPPGCSSAFFVRSFDDKRKMLANLSSVLRVSLIHQQNRPADRSHRWQPRLAFGIWRWGG